MEVVPEIVVPGDLLATSSSVASSSSSSSSSSSKKSICAGTGCYEVEGKEEIRASLVGKVVVETLSDGVLRYNVSPLQSVDPGIQVGDSVIARVIRLQINRVDLDILSVNDSNTLLKSFPKGIVRREDVRLTEVDSLVMHECFHPGDIIRAKILSLGDSRSYFCATSDVNMGVVHALSKSGNVLTPVSWNEMIDKITQEKEARKVAKP